MAPSMRQIEQGNDKPGNSKLGAQFNLSLYLLSCYFAECLQAMDGSGPRRRRSRSSRFTLQ